MKVINKRSIALLEVLIAFAIIALCIIPLIYPHVFIFKSEKKFVYAVELDHLANLLYADVLQKLYQNEIPWENLEKGERFPIDSRLLESLGYDEQLPYQGTYQFITIKQKPHKPSDRSVYLFELIFTFTESPTFFLEKDLKEKNPQVIYRYQLAMERILQ